MKPRADTLTSYLYIVHHSRVDRKHFFVIGYFEVWNSLPAAADAFATVRFTRLIERVDLSEQ